MSGQKLPSVSCDSDLSQISHRLTGLYRTQADSLDIRRTLTCGFGFWRTGWTDGIGLRIRSRRSGYPAADGYGLN